VEGGRGGEKGDPRSKKENGIEALSCTVQHRRGQQRGAVLPGRDYRIRRKKKRKKKKKKGVVNQIKRGVVLRHYI